MAEYSEANMTFQQTIVASGGCGLIVDMTENLFIHMRGIRKLTIGQDNRADRSIVDHMEIIEALEGRDPDLAERLVRAHTLGLARHVARHPGFPDYPDGSRAERSAIRPDGANPKHPGRLPNGRS